MAVSLHLDCPSRVIPTVLATIRLIITINSTRLHSGPRLDTALHTKSIQVCGDVCVGMVSERQYRAN